MIEIKRGANCITIQGHAEYAPHGKDIVCAAVSALVHTLVASLEKLTTDAIEYDMTAGAAYIKHGNLSERAALLVDCFFVGAHLIADEYPERVKMV